MRTEYGTIKYINDDRGFGFLKKDDGGQDIFFHYRNFPADTDPKIGMRVSYDVAMNERSGKPQAVGLQVIGF